jgi:hypothetical protein
MKLNFKLCSSLVLGTLVGSALASEVSYRGEIRPLVQKQCAECHGDNAPSLADFLLDQEKFKKDKTGPRTTSYGDLIALVGWPDTGSLMRRLDDGANTADKKAGNMYKYLGETDAERATNLALIKAWVGEGAWNLKRWSKRGEVAAVTKEELNLLKLKY